ncbi:hypothetical protein VMCG_10704 [Cytospora schulzeri]|uniref:Uncharacterized protein n=1 Tax=Cytospora schulzeri TaxID=448051 RepID=A0A423V952_9PEZI|nr:hypothetical protein VMCG_10704 [Valsa malicola]
MPVTTRAQARREAHAARRRTLLRLPREIRNDIYKRVLAPRNASKWNPRGTSFPGDAFPLNANDAMLLMGKRPAYVGLLQSCRQVHEEAAGLLYHTVEMRLNTNREPEKALLTLGLRHLKYIKHMTIHFRYYVRRPDGWNGSLKDSLGAWRAAEILRFLHRAGVMLHTLTLKAPWHQEGCTGSGNLAHARCVDLQPLLRDPFLFSNIQSVVFPDLLALCPSRNALYDAPERNRPLTEAQKAEIVERLRFQVEAVTDCATFKPTYAPFHKGFFVIVNPRALSIGLKGSVPPPCEGEWGDMVQEHLARLKTNGFLDYRMDEPGL